MNQKMSCFYEPGWLRVGLFQQFASLEGKMFLAGKQVLRFRAENSKVANSDEGSGAELKRKQ